jgi:nitrite reductase (NADH) large subunit
MSWECGVCGYVHDGSEPPDSCPVCGVGPEEFAPLDVPAVEAVRPKTWICGVCGYEHQGEDPPAECPVCGVGPDEFEPVEPPDKATEDLPEDLGPIVVVGGGVAGVTAAERARAAAWAAPIVLVTAEPGLPLMRLNLTRYLAGDVGEQGLLIKPDEWFDEQRIELVHGRVVAIDRELCTLRLEDGTEVPFGRLVLTTGAAPFVPPIPGTHLGGVETLRTRADADRILQRARPDSRCVVIGGGLLGLETAGALARRGAKVAVLEGSGHLLSRQLAEAPAEVLADHVEALGVRLRLEARVERLVGKDAIEAVQVEGLGAIPADLVVLSTGVRCETALALDCGLEANRGVLVDDRMATSDPLIYAAGDGTEHRGVCYGLWSVAFAQGAIAGTNAGGGSATFLGVPPSTRLKILDVTVLSAGRHEEREGDEVLEEAGGEACVRLVIHEGVLVGANLVGHADLAGPLTVAVADGALVQALVEPLASLVERLRSS